MSRKEDVATGGDLARELFLQPVLHRYHFVVDPAPMETQHENEAAPIEGVVDPEKEKERIEKKIGETERYITSLKKKLENKGFVDRAPKEVVEKEKGKLADAERLLNSHQEQFALLK